MRINCDDEREPGLSTFVERGAPLHRHATPVRTEWDLADPVDGNRASPRRCDRKAISRTNNFYEVYPPQRPEDMPGMWRCYYEKWRQATREHIDPRLLELMPPFPELAPPALVIDKPVYSAFAGHLLHDELMRRHSDTLILTGAETDVCVLSTALGAIDHGYRVIIAEDAVCSSSDQGHDSLLALFAQRFSHQLDVADTHTILGA